MGVGDVPLDDPEGYLGVHLAEGEEAA